MGELTTSEDTVAATEGGGSGDGSEAGGAVLPRGSELGRYVVLERVGSGGMGVVYGAYDPKLDRRVAIKVLHPASRTDRRRRQLADEARSLARLSHSNVVAVHDVDDEGSQVFIAMEFVDGPTLREWLTEHRGWRAILDAFIAAGEGLAAAHDQGLVHKDFKPDNVKVAPDGRVVVIDFGLAADARRGAGTPRYMSPEQHAGAAVGPVSDQFSFCVALYEALYGDHPFAGDSVVELVSSVSVGSARSPSRGSGPPSLQAIVLRGLERDPALRWPSMGALLAELSAATAPRGNRRALLGVGLAGLAAIAVAVAIQGDEECSAPDGAWDEVWNADRRVEILAALTRDAGEEPAALVGAHIDGYVEAWTREYVAACEATRVRHEHSAGMFDKRIACLDRRREEVASVLDVLGRGDPQIALRSLEVVESMQPLRRCRDYSFLLSSVSVPPAEVEGEVAARRVDIGLARALREGTKLDEARALLEATLERAEESEYVPLIVETKLELGRTLLDREDPVGARLLLEDAAWSALDIGHEPVALAAATELAGPGPYTRADREFGRAWWDRAQALLGRRSDRSARARLQGNFGMLLARVGEQRQAKEHLEDAMALLEAQGEADDPKYLDWMQRRGVVMYELGDSEQGIKILADVVAQRRATRGARHPRVGHSLVTLGAMRSGRGDPEQGERDLLTAVELLQAQAGQESRFLAGAHNNLGNHFRRHKRFDKAREHLVEALRLWGQHGDAFADSLVYGYAALGSVALDEEDWSDAARQTERALALIRETQRGSHRLRPVVASGLALARAQLGRAGAIELVDEALGLTPTASAEGPVIARVRCARALIVLGDEERARRLVVETIAQLGDLAIEEAVRTELLDLDAELRVD